MSVQLPSREIVRRCVEFDDPPRIGLHFRMSVQGRRYDVSDFAAVGMGGDPDAHRTDGKDEWGLSRVSFDPTGTNMGQVKEHPLEAGWHLLDTYPFPDFAKPVRYAKLAENVARQHAEGLYAYGWLPQLMTLPGELRGLENWFMDHLLHPEELGRLLDIIVEARLHIIDAYGRAGADGMITWDDMGSHAQPMVSPELFRSLYLPRYKRTCDALHERGMHFIHHCCGQVRPYVEMFIEAGCDVLQLDQPTLMGIDWLSENFGGKICFWNPVDIQKTIGRGDLDAIADEAHHQVWAFGQAGGGFMVKAYQQSDSINMTADEFEAQYNAFMQHAFYPLQPYVSRRSDNEGRRVR